jgi:hypothetical protein
VRLADPVAELAAGQPTLHERGLEHVDHPLAVGMRRPQPARAAAFSFPAPAITAPPVEEDSDISVGAAALWPTILRPSQHAYLSGFGEHT